MASRSNSGCGPSALLRPIRERFNEGFATAYVAGAQRLPEELAT
jgi:hypothetical protein